MPYRLDVAAVSNGQERSKQDENYLRGVTSLQLDFDSSASLLTKFAELEKQLAEEKEETKHWMQVYECAERTHAELTELRLAAHKQQITELRREIDTYKQQRTATAVQKRKPTATVRTRGNSLTHRHKGKPVVSEPSKPKEAEADDVEGISYRQRRLLEECTDPSSASLRDLAISTKPIFSFPLNNQHTPKAELAAEPVEASSPRSVRTLPSRTPSPATSRPTTAKPAPPPMFDFAFNAMRGLPPIPRFRATGKQRASPADRVIKAKPAPKAVHHSIPSAVRGVFRNAQAALQQATALPFVALDAMHLPEALIETIGNILAGWVRAEASMVIEKQETAMLDVDDRISAYEESLLAEDKPQKVIFMEDEDSSSEEL